MQSWNSTIIMLHNSDSKIKLILSSMLSNLQKFLVT